MLVSALCMASSMEEALGSALSYPLRHQAGQHEQRLVPFTAAREREMERKKERNGKKGSETVREIRRGRRGEGGCKISI